MGRRIEFWVEMVASLVWMLLGSVFLQNGLPGWALVTFGLWLACVLRAGRIAGRL